MGADLSKAERFLLVWLSREDFSLYGECHGASLNSLVAKGFAVVHTAGEHQGGFIAKGGGDMYRAVSLTDAGRAAVTPAR